MTRTFRRSSPTREERVPNQSEKKVTSFSCLSVFSGRENLVWGFLFFVVVVVLFGFFSFADPPLLLMLLHQLRLGENDRVRFQDGLVQAGLDRVVQDGRDQPLEDRQHRDVGLDQDRVVPGDRIVPPFAVEHALHDELLPDCVRHEDKEERRRKLRQPLLDAAVVAPVVRAEDPVADPGSQEKQAGVVDAVQQSVDWPRNVGLDRFALGDDGASADLVGELPYAREEKPDPEQVEEGPRELLERVEGAHRRDREDGARVLADHGERFRR